MQGEHFLSSCQNIMTLHSGEAEYSTLSDSSLCTLVEKCKKNKALILTFVLIFAKMSQKRFSCLNFLTVILVCLKPKFMTGINDLSRKRRC